MLRYSFDEHDAATAIERAVSQAIEQGVRTGDIAAPGTPAVGTARMGQTILENL